MKRVIIVIGVVVGVAAAAAVPALAGTGVSGVCTEGQPPSATQEWVIGDNPGDPASLALEADDGSSTGTTILSVCYSDTPDGTPSNLAGGFVAAHRYTSDGAVRVFCAGESPATATVNCDSYFRVTPTDDPSRIGTTAEATVTVLTVSGNLNRTGAEAATPGASPELPFDGDSFTGGSAGIGPGTCVWVNSSSGVPTNCPLGATAAGVTVNEADLLDVNTPTGGGCIGVNSTCLVPNSGVGVGQDGNKTVTIDNPITVTTTADLPPQCVQVGASC